MRKLLFILALLCVPLARGQSSFQNPLQGPITSTSAACAVAGDQSCVWQKLAANAAVATVQVSGTFSATLTVEANNGGANFTALGTITTAGTTSYVVAGFTDFRVRASAYTSGTAFVTINSSVAPSGGVTSGTGAPTGSCTANQIYVNQSNGNLYSCSGGSWVLSGGGGTTLTLQTNGVNNGSQTLLNLAGSTNVTVTDNGSGTDTVALTGLSPAPAPLAVVANTFVTGYNQGTGAWNVGEVIGNDINGATSLPAYTLTGTPNTGNATTSVPLWYYFCSGAAAPTTWSTNGTILGMNACTGFTGKYIDIKAPNGGGTVFSVDQAGGMAAGTIAGSSGITAAAGSNLGLNGRTQFRSAADGRISVNNNANGANGLTRFTWGTEAAATPALCPLAGIAVTCDGAGTTTFGNNTPWSVTANKVFVTTNFTTAASTALQTITGLTFNFPAIAQNWEYNCDITYSQGTANAAVAFGIQAATNNPTNIFGTGIQQITVGPPATFVAGTLATLATTTATAIVTGTPGATATNYTVHLAGMLELGASANAVNIMVSTATAADAVTVLRGSSCRIF